ncbi:hypothetical protein GXP67_33700 [Rhodocytophaga rosea]|uniref:Uncharacterized protein n=1 Tax=Rhodocytophaga rosea TaxID=2704465 RepID=A0A6C0GSY6_9BACT|nr:hypothetical protein [Rhodocytophaga rosea]QHT71259.1 hypothetical protein GXP67_33700 [Rhodocytophaga rosea]
MKIIYVFLVIICFGSCNRNNNSKPVHKDLLGFKADFRVESDDKRYDRLELKLGKLQIRYIEDIIYVSTYAEVNACGDFQGNIQIKNDSIMLKYEYISDLACTSVAIEKLTYLIDNPGKSRRKIKFED